MGCWAAPYKTKQAEAIRQLMMEPLAAGIANGKLYHFVGDDDLADDVDDLKSEDDCRSTVMNFLQGWFGKHGNDKEMREDWGWSERFDDGALVIFEEMLTDWEVNKRFPADRTRDGKTIMTPRQLANYVARYLEDVGGSHPMVARNAFMRMFPNIQITAKKDGTFVVDLVD